jgi:hypothetical protein
MTSLERAEFIAAESFAEEIAAAEAAAAIEAVTNVVFYWVIDDLLDPIKMISNYKGKNIVSQDKEPRARLEDLNITDDEDTMLRRLLKNAAAEVYSHIAAYGKGISAGYLYDPDVEEPIEYDALTEYNENDLFYVTGQLYRCLADETPAGTDPTDTDYFEPVGEEYNTYNKVVYTINYNTQMDSNMILVLDQALEDCIVKHVLYNWYRTLQEIPMIMIAKDEYEEAVSKVQTAMWFRKVLTRRRVELL